MHIRRRQQTMSTQSFTSCPANTSTSNYCPPPFSIPPPSPIPSPIPRIPNRASFLHHSTSLYPTRLPLGAAVAIPLASHSGIAPGNDGLRKVTFNPTLNSLDEFTAILHHHPTDINSQGRWASAVRRFVHRVCQLERGEQLQLQLLSPSELKAIYSEQVYIDVLLAVLFFLLPPPPVATCTRPALLTLSIVLVPASPRFFPPFSFSVTFARLAIPQTAKLVFDLH